VHTPSLSSVCDGSSSQVLLEGHHCCPTSATLPKMPGLFALGTSLLQARRERGQQPWHTRLITVSVAAAAASVIAERLIINNVRDSFNRQQVSEFLVDSVHNCRCTPQRGRWMKCWLLTAAAVYMTKNNRPMYNAHLRLSLTLSVMSLVVDKQTISCKRMLSFYWNTQELKKDMLLKDWCWNFREKMT